MSGAVVLRVLDYGGQGGTTAQEELPASDTAPYSYRGKGQDGKFTQISYFPILQREVIRQDYVFFHISDSKIASSR